MSRALTSALLSAAVFAASLPALAAFRVAGAAGVLLAASAGSATVTIVTAGWWRVAPPRTYLVSAAGLAVLLAAVSGPHPGAIANALVYGPGHLVTEALPVQGGRVQLASLVVTVWVLSAAAAEVTHRSRGATAFAAPLVLYVASFALASGSPQPRYSTGPLLLLLLAAAATARRWQTGRPFRRRAAVGVSAVAAVAASMTIVGPAFPVPAGRPLVAHRPPPTAAPTVTDPLAAMASLRDSHPRSPPVPEMEVRLDAPSTGYLAVALLDQYDGAEWSFSASFEPTGGVMPLAAPFVPAPPVTQRIALERPLPVPMLPALDRPVDVSGASVSADVKTAMFLAQTAPGARRYTVVSEPPPVTLLAVPTADRLAPASAFPQASMLPPATRADVAAAVRYVGLLSGVRPSATLSFLDGALAALRSDERTLGPALAPGGPPGGGDGTSLSQVLDAVTVDHAATPEQFATFFALTARWLGVPARVVTGFRIGGGAPVGQGRYLVTDRQAWAWVELPVTGVGWVVADPTPAATTARAVPPPLQVQAPPTTAAPRPAAAMPASRFDGGRALAPPGRVSGPGAAPDRSWLVLAVLAAALAAAFAAGPAVAGARRLNRRRVRRSGDPRALSVGAWLELLDSLYRAGHFPHPAATSAEVASEVGNHFHADMVEPVAMVGRAADAALYSTAVQVTPAAARAAWEAQCHLRRQVMAALDRRARLRARLKVGRAPARPQEAARRLW